MKDYIIAFFVVLGISCFLNSLGESVPSSMPVGISGTVETPTGSKRSDSQIPEINMTDAAANATQIIDVNDTDQHKGSHSQNGNNF